MIKNIWNQNINNFIKSNDGEGLQLWYKYNGIYYFKKIIEGTNIKLVDTPDNVTINATNQYTRRFLISGLSDPMKDILNFRGLDTLYINIVGKTDIPLQCNIVVTDTFYHYLGVHNTETDFTIVPLNPDMKSNISIKLNTIKEFQYFFEVSSKQPFLTHSDHYEITYIS